MARATAAACIVGSCLVAHAQAKLAYDNFLPDGSFFRIGWSVVHTPLPGSFAIEQAESFAPWQSGTASRLTAALGHAHGAAMVVVELRSDDHGRLGRRVGAPCLLATRPGSAGTQRAVASGPLAGLGWHLKAGRRYWLLARGARFGDHAWQINLAGAQGPRYVLDSREPGAQYGQGTQGAFRIELAPYAGVFG